MPRMTGFRTDVYDLHQQGYDGQQIAGALGISRQRVSQILSARGIKRYPGAKPGKPLGHVPERRIKVIVDTGFVDPINVRGPEDGLPKFALNDLHIAAVRRLSGGLGFGRIDFETKQIVYA